MRKLDTFCIDRYEGVLVDAAGSVCAAAGKRLCTRFAGYYVDTVINGNGCLYATTAHATSYWDYSTGFRCCAAL